MSAEEIPQITGQLFVMLLMQSCDFHSKYTPISHPLPLPLEIETTHKACTSIKQNFSRPVVMQNHSLVQNNGLKSKRLNNQKQGIILYTYPKYTTNLSVSTLSTQKRGRGKRRQRHHLPKSH